MTQCVPPLHPAAAGVVWPSSRLHEQQLSDSEINSFRLKTVVERLAVLLQNGGPSTHKTAAEISSHCLSLSREKVLGAFTDIQCLERRELGVYRRTYQGEWYIHEFLELKISNNGNWEFVIERKRGIDFSVAHKEVPDTVKDLPILLKKDVIEHPICQLKGDIRLQAGVMVMMLSVKNACKSRWFSDVETQELLALFNEVGSFFGSLKSLGDVNNGLESVISAVMSRFHPLMKMGDILVSLEAQPGYGAYVTDFHISKNIVPGPKEKVRLFVVQVDYIDTPACIITPQQVNFLLNGKGVESRTNLFTDTGPQMPTNVTNMLKYGTNLLQAIGQFTGKCLIVVAFMSTTSSPDCSVLPDYVNTTAASHSEDSDIIEGPSRISLNCPISRTRIETPVKGQACNHLQCFDFKNYIDINSRRPSWRCPHCNRHVCYTDIRIDQHIVKVLKEVSPNVSAVIVTANGSWKAVSCSDDVADQPSKDVDSQKDKSASTSDVVMDLTEACTGDTNEVENQKPLHHQSSNINLAATSEQNFPVEDDFWSGLDLFNGPAVQESIIPSSSPASLPLFRADGSGANSNQIAAPSAVQLHQSQNMNSFSDLNPEYGTMQFGHENVNRPPVAVQLPGSSVASLSLVRGDATGANSSQISAPSAAQLHQSPIINSVLASNPEYGTARSGDRNVYRTPIAVQALPAQVRTPTMQQRPRTNSNISATNASHVPSPVTQPVPPAPSGFNTTSTDIGLLLQHSGSQNWSHQGSIQFTPREPYQQLSSTPFPPAPRVSSVVVNQFHNLVHQASPNPHCGIPSLALSQAPSPMALAYTPQVGLSPAPHMASRYAASAHLAQMSRTVSPSAQLAQAQVQAQLSRTGSPFSMTVDNLMSSMGLQMATAGLGGAQLVSTPDAAAAAAGSLADQQQNWLPATRMRGSLTGRHYSDAAVRELMIQPTVSTRPTRLPQMSQPSLSTKLPLMQPQFANSSIPNLPRTQS